VAISSNVVDDIDTLIVLCALKCILACIGLLHIIHKQKSHITQTQCVPRNFRQGVR